MLFKLIYYTKENNMKRLVLLLVFVLATSVFVCCTPANVSAPAPAPAVPDASDVPDAPVGNSPVSISVVTSYGGDDGNRYNYEKAYKAYEAASGNIINDNSGISKEEWKAQVMASFESGSEPDVLFYFTGVDSNKIVESGKVVSIDEIRAVYPDYASNMKDGMLAKSPVDGKSYAVPVNGYWEGMFVNKKVLEDCGVSIPDANTTWEQFLLDCQKIADKGYVPIAASLNEIPHYWFEFCVFNYGNPENHATIPQSSSDAAGQNWAAGLGDIKELYERGFFPENTTTCTDSETDALMAENKAAFKIDGSWKMGWFAENAADINNFTVTYVPGKGERKATDIIGGLSMGYFITKKAWQNPEKQSACVDFIKAMTTDEVVTTFGATAVTALINGTTPPPDANNLVNDALDMTRNCTGIATATADGLVLDSRSDLFGNVKNIVTGSMTAQEAIDHCLSIK